MSDAELKLLEQFGGTDAPRFVPAPDTTGDRVVDVFGNPVQSFSEAADTADLGGVQRGGAVRQRRQRRRMSRRRKSRRRNTRRRESRRSH